MRTSADGETGEQRGSHAVPPGPEKRGAGYRQIIDQVLGGIASGTLQPGDQFAMCSDGLWSEIEDAELREVLADGQPAQACRQLLDLALAQIDSDNTSVRPRPLSRTVPKRLSDCFKVSAAAR